MREHIFGDAKALRFEVGPLDPDSDAMRCVDIHALGLHVTANDNSVYVPNLLLHLERALASFRKGTRFEQRPDVFEDLGPDEIHRIFTDGSNEFPGKSQLSSPWRFLAFGDVSLHAMSLLIPTRGRLYLTLGLSLYEEGRKDFRCAEVSAEALNRAMAATFERVSSDYEPNPSSLS